MEPEKPVELPKTSETIPVQPQLQVRAPVNPKRWPYKNATSYR